MRSDQIRETFLAFFEERGHTRVPSSSLVPSDPSLLLTTAGMVQFKPYFLGQQEPPYPRAASVQKSFRTTDIENVGLTARHMTMFEMLGNFSFGDYFKEGAIDLAWELVTQGYGIEPDRLWVTVYEKDRKAEELWGESAFDRDEEAERFWRKHLPADRIVYRGIDDNFWSMGVAGPCGPSSEIFVDRGLKYGPDGGPAVDEERFLEIWNLVFMQYERDDDFNLVGKLARTGVDTGSGLERVAIVLQDVPSVYETDGFVPLMETAQAATDHTYGRDEGTDVSLRILAEHGRACSFLIADGVLPSNEGRGYVLRRMLRRVVSHARRLGVEQEVTRPLVERTVEILGDAYPELVEQKAFILQVAAAEEEHFGTTLRAGMVRFEEEVRRATDRGDRKFPGEAAFLAHDTYGFPIELTVELAEEEGLQVDTAEFERLMDEQRRRARERARPAGDQQTLVEIGKEAGPTEFLGYRDTRAESRLVGLTADGRRLQGAADGDRVELVLDRTPFYAEGGGQVGDAGEIRTPTGAIGIEDTVPGPGGIIVHRGTVSSGEVKVGQEADAEVDEARRAATERSHTGTHVLHWTLRSMLGEHARQAGSLVAAGRLRFDFNHFEALSPDRLEEIEGTVNRRLGEDVPVRAYETTFEFARSQGAIALFEETYGDMVRVVEIGDYSTELCGGTHVARTGQVSLGLLLSEGSIGSGLRRIEALVGEDALEHFRLERRLLEEVTGALGAGDPAQAPERARRAVTRIKELEQRLATIQAVERDNLAKAWAEDPQVIEGVALVVQPAIGGEGTNELKQRAELTRRYLEPRGPGAVVLGIDNNGKASLVAACTSELVKRGISAPRLLEPVAKLVGGRAGGKPHLAFGGGPNAQGLQTALASVPGHLKSLLDGG